MLQLLKEYMRLAADYQQSKNRKNQKDPPLNSKKVVKLGQGLPQEEKRKRGISRSEENSRIERMSLGKGDVSKEKLAELQKQQTKFGLAKPTLERPPQKIVTAACYGNRDGRLDSYANQHLLITSPTKYNPPEVRSAMNHNLKAVKSRGTIVSHNIYQNSSKISAENIKTEVYFHPTPNLLQPQRSPSLEAGHLVKFNWNQASNPNIKLIQQDPRAHQFASRPSQEEFSRLSLRSKQGIYERPKPQSPEVLNTPVVFPETATKIHAIATQKMISSKDDPYNLYSSKMTRRLGDTSPGKFIEQELKETKKQLKGVPEGKELSSSISRVSLQNSRNRSNKKVTSLWQAQKAESRVSLKESQQIKIQQSAIMMNYFNPSDSMMKRL